MDGNTVIKETGEVIDNGLSEIYVNTAINDGSTIAELMECFMQEQVENAKSLFENGCSLFRFKNKVVIVIM